MTRTLLVGPWVGEFGFEVAIWAPHARRIAWNFDHVTVACEPGHEALYEDFADEFELFTVPDSVLIRDCEYGHTTGAIGDSAPKLELPPLRAADHWLHPYRLRQTMSWPWDAMPFMPEGTFEPRKLCGTAPLGWIAVHARSDFKQSIKSWPIQKWHDLCCELSKTHVVYSIGTKKGAMQPECCVDRDGMEIDRRDQPVANTIVSLSGTSVLVSPASGPTALAMHCGIPCVWWADTAQNAHLLFEQEGAVAACWNPHKVKHYRAAETWDPSVEQVLEAVKVALT